MSPASKPMGVDQRDVEKLLQEGEFDPDWYDEFYADAAIMGMGPAEHYLLIGKDLGRARNLAALRRRSGATRDRRGG
jgi:hypothetical protein